MKIVLLTESLGSGGTERQVCVLAGEFKRRGHQVCVATYLQNDFYLTLLERENVEHRFLSGHGKLSWTLSVRRFLRKCGQDVVLAFLEGPSAYAELAGLPTRSWGLVVSERSSGVTSGRGLKANLHMLADYVITNSHSARVAIEERLPCLGPKLITIYNAVRIGPTGLSQQVTCEPYEIRLVVAARLDRNKNPHGLLSAVQILDASQPSLRLHIDWYGDLEVEPEVFREVQAGITSLGLAGKFRLHPPTDGIHDIVSQADAVILASFYEGLPNAVCEGMALGKPILMSAVCDAANLVKEGINGFLFDPHCPNSIASAIARFARLTPEDWHRMGKASRARAEVLFGVNIVVEHYLRILEAAAERKAVKTEHWPGQVPETTLCISEPSRGGPDRR